jgi:hypothetical protein
MGMGVNNGFAAGETIDADVQETTNDGPKYEKKK